ncbi:MAG: hypothetical protein OXG27_13835 [Chloroflexi bacterium]|nr:hypothetical protein [Chloroflexota bacterium]
MQIRISTDPIGPLRVLDELPDVPLSVIEGRNGIGKSLAVRLLEICCGEMPYRLRSPAWESLRNGLGRFEVRAKDLNGAKLVLWRADSRGWPSEPGGAPDGAWFETIEVDGARATMSDIRALLRVHRIAGDEGIVETLASRADAEAEAVHRWAARYTWEEGTPLALLEHKADDLRLMFGGWTDAAIPVLRESLVKAKEQHESAAAEAQRIYLQHKLVSDAADLQRQLDRYSEEAPQLQEELKAVEGDIANRQARRETIDTELRRIVQSSALAGPVQKELRNAQRTTSKNRRLLADSVKQASTLATQLGIVNERLKAEAEAASVGEVIEALELERRSLDAAPVMRELLDEITDRLSQGEETGLADEIAVEEPETNTSLTVAQTRSGMYNRRRALEGHPPAPEAEAVQEKLVAQSRRQAQVAALLVHINDVERYKRLVQTNEERVRKAVAAFPAAGSGGVRSLEEEKAQLDDEIVELAGRRASLVERLGGSSVSDPAVVGERLERSLESAGVPRELLGDALVEYGEALEAARDAERAARESLSARRSELARTESEVQRAWNMLANREDLGWLRDALVLDPAQHASNEAQARRIESLRDRLDAVLDRLGAVRGQLAAVERALIGVGRHIRSQSPEAEVYVKELKSWLGQRFSDWFNNERVRRELLPQAEGEIVVDLEAREVLWAEGEIIRSRPLEAFSSGEQAFAYTRARLGLLDDEDNPPQNRLVVLDEFGAFIAHDRLQQLFDVLEDRIPQHPTDQVVVILPLARDYEQLEKTALKTEQRGLQDMAEQVASKGYGVRELVR